MLRRGLGGVLPMLVSATALAQTAQGGRGMRLDYQRAPNVATVCPDEETFRQMVGVFAKGEDPFRADAADVVRVTLEQRGSGYHATIAVLGPDGVQRGKAEEHTLRTCPEAAREAASTAYLVAAPFVFPAPPASAAPIPAPPTTAPLPSPSPPARRVFVLLGAGAGLVVGFSPNPSAGFGGLVGVRIAGSPSWSISAEGRADIDTAGDAVVQANGTSAKPSAGFAGATLAPCVHASWFFGCALATLGQVRASAGDDAAPQAGEGLYFGLGARAGLEVPLLSRRAPALAHASTATLPPAVALPLPPVLVLQLAADGLLTVARPGVLVNGAELWQAPIAAGMFGARLVTIF